MVKLVEGKTFWQGFRVKQWKWREVIAVIAS